ncbi:MAG: GntR family transcriptional regulator [Pigmentiphaga sp.]|uniref:GntR family transcriptional regulator n=1 Tax=Pigmentiphaga sp. TaxID=1977564 RepID=UPI0029BE147C|nr:GntR family transcriptional regulator [Pigmentiphaga sp.]MDX3906743.1 GntR family transcriptional regulator [Pigmentiphaga sp.]
MAKSAVPPSDHGTVMPTMATTLYDRMRADLLAGRLLPPGRKLQIEFLSHHYGAGQTPVREALNRLTADGLVEQRDQRGFAVAAVSPADLVEITNTRCWLEEIALRKSMASGSAQWEEELVLAFHRLTKTQRSLHPDRFEANPEWEQRHRAFHRALIGGCGSRWLIGFCEQLADQLYRYRQLSVQKIFPDRPIQQEHEALMEAITAGDADLAVSLLTEHYQKTARIVLEDPDAFGD